MHRVSIDGLTHYKQYVRAAEANFLRINTSDDRQAVINVDTQKSEIYQRL